MILVVPTFDVIVRTPLYVRLPVGVVPITIAPPPLHAVIVTPPLVVVVKLGIEKAAMNGLLVTARL